LRVERGIVVDDQLRTNDHAIFAIGECAQHRGKVYGLVDPGYDQARILADLLSDARPTAVYTGSRLATTLKVLDVDLLALGDVHVRDGQAEVVSHLDATRGIYKKLVVRDGKLVGAILLGTTDAGGRLTRPFKEQHKLEAAPLDLLRDELPTEDAVLALPDDAQICNCHQVPKRTILQAI